MTLIDLLCTPEIPSIHLPWTCAATGVACHGHGTTLRGFLPRGWDHPVASDGTTRRVVPVVLVAFLLGCRQVVGLGGWGGWCSGRSA